MTLTVTTIKNSKPKSKAYRLFDEKGLYIEISPKGGKWWRFKYRFDGKEKRISLGTYPEISLKDARDRRDESRTFVASGIDPSEHRKASKLSKLNTNSNSFEVIAREWHIKQSLTWSESHTKRIINRLVNDIFPWLGSLPISEITPPQLLDVIRKIENRGAIESAHRALNTCGQIFRFAIATGRAERNPSSDLKGALSPVKKENFAAITEPTEVGEFLRVINNYQGTHTVCSALKLAPLVFARPGELRKAEWKDINFETAEWRYRASKTNPNHIVPLSNQAISILKNIHPLTGHGRFIFPCARNPKGDRPMSDNAILSAFRRMGIEQDQMTGNGFRTMARTILDEVLGFRPDFIEHQLAHAVRDPNGRAYNRTAHLKERKEMMQQWADYLENLSSPSTP